MRAIQAHLAGSSSFSESYDSQDVQNLICERREGGNLNSEATQEVGQLELCLDAAKTTLSGSEEEINVARMRDDEAHARVAGKISLKSLCFYNHDFIR